MLKTFESWTQTDIERFLSLQLPDAETVALLHQMTPEAIDRPFFEKLLIGMRAKALPLTATTTSILDCCGTGGSGLARFNASTTAAFIMAAGGVPIVKFGNRGISSRSGSFDLLEHIGIPSHWSLTALPELLSDCKLVFLYAPQIYPELAEFSRLRRETGVQTVFNFMGPLLNPLNPTYRLTGVSHPKMHHLIAEILRDDPHTSSAWVVRAENGLDELSHNGVTDILDIKKGMLTEWQYQPEFQGQAFDADLQHTPAENYKLFQAIISAEDGQSAYHRISCLNAGAGFFLAGKASTFDEGVLLAEDLLFNRKVAELVEKVRRIYARIR